VINQTAALRRLLADEAFIHLPVAYDALGGRLIESTGFKSAYVGGFVTGGSRCTSEPLLTLDEQVRVAGDVARAVKISKPQICLALRVSTAHPVTINLSSWPFCRA